MKFNIRIIIWLTLAILTIPVFWTWIPLGIYNTAYIVFSILGGVVFGGFLALCIGDFTASSDDPHTKNIQGAAALAIIPGIVMIIVLLFHFDTRKDTVLEKEGVISSAEIIDGQSSTSTKSSSYEVKIRYQPPNDRKYTITESVSSTTYDKMYVGASVDIIYWKEDASVVKALLSDEEIKKAFHIPDRHLDFHDFEKIFAGKVKFDSVLTYLNKISYKWVDKDGLLVNERKQNALKLDPENNTIIFMDIHSGFNVAGSFEQSLDANVFRKSARLVDQKEQVSYESNNYVIYKEEKEKAEEAKNSHDQYSFLRPKKVICIYTILRKG